MSYNELKRHKKRVAFVCNTSSFTGWSDNFGAKWQLWCQSDDFNRKVWVAMHGVGWRVKKVMTSVCWHHHVENVRKDRYRSMRRHSFWCLTHIYLSATYESIRTGAIFFVVQMLERKTAFLLWWVLFSSCCVTSDCIHLLPFPILCAAHF